MNVLEKRVVELSYRHKLTHVSSCLNTVNLLNRIYSERRDNEPVVLDNGHAALALYVVLESRKMCDAEAMIHKHGVHASRDIENGIYVSNGSLGQAATVALGMALSDQLRKVWLVTSDGACMEGVLHEVCRVAYHRAPNLEIHVVFNGYGAYGKINFGDIPAEPEIHHVGHNYPEWLRGLQGHYLVLNKEQYEELMA